MYNYKRLVYFTCFLYNIHFNIIICTGSSDMIIWMDDVNCTGYEHYLSDCPFNGWSYHDCSHNNDAGVKCQGTT